VREEKENSPFFCMGTGGSTGPRDYRPKESVFAVSRICAITACYIEVDD
jgi:hypothetical protein